MVPPGMEWDFDRNTWKPVDYSALTVEQMAERRRVSDQREKETLAQLEAILPAVAVQNLLNKSALDLRELIVDLAKKSPGQILALIGV